MSARPKIQRIIFHFGMDKTGSTSIRSSLCRKLNDRRYCYLTPGGLENSSQFLVAAFRDDPLRFHFFQKTGLRPDQIPQIRSSAIDGLDQELRRATGKTAIISAEALSVFKEHELLSVYNFFSQYTNNLEAVAYIRRPKEYLESNLQQQIKAGKLSTLKSDQFVLGALVPAYKSRFQIFDSIFGLEKVKFWLFDRNSFFGKDVVVDFCTRCGIEFSPTDVVASNEGLSLSALKLLLALRSFEEHKVFDKNLVKADYMLINYIRRLDGPKLRLHSSVACPAIEAKRDETIWMQDRLGVSLSEDYTAHDVTALKSPQELYRFDPDSLSWLAKQLGKWAENRCSPDLKAKKVAKWMSFLREKIATERGLM